MKRKLVAVLTIAMICLGLLVGCQKAVRSHGGTMSIELKPNTKLELITWKEDSLWYLTRPMREGDIAETHTYQQKTDFGLLEGTITIIESRE